MKNYLMNINNAPGNLLRVDALGRVEVALSVGRLKGFPAEVAKTVLSSRRISSTQASVIAEHLAQRTGEEGVEPCIYSGIA